MKRRGFVYSGNNFLAENGTNVVGVVGLMIFLITFCLIQISDYLQTLANSKEIVS